MIVCGQMGETCRTECDCKSRQIECPACDGKGCQACNQSGSFYLDVCGHKYAAEMGTLVHYADLYEKGLPPVAGGTLDQSAWFTDAAQLYWAETSKIKNEMLKNARP